MSDRPKKKRTWKKNLLLLLGSLVFCFALLEFGLFLMVKTGLLNMEMPSYSLNQTTLLKDFWVVLDENFGRWRLPGVTFTHRKACFTAEYTTNSAGMRDPERDIHSNATRVVALGDSYVEGWGLNYGQRITDLLEQRTGLEHLNFACADFTPTQYLLAYATLAKKYDHQAVIIGLFPENDLENPGQPPKPDKKFRKPYFSGAYPDYALHKPTDLADLDNAASRLWWKVNHINSKRILQNFTFTYNAILYLEKLRERKEEEKLNLNEHPSHYWDYTPESLELLGYILERIREEAGDRPVMLFSIPSERDFMALEEREVDERGEPPLVGELRELCRKSGMEYMDMLTAMARTGDDWQDYIISCDGHLTALANQVASDLLYDSEFYAGILTKQAGE